MWGSNYIRSTALSNLLQIHSYSQPTEQQDKKLSRSSFLNILTRPPHKKSQKQPPIHKYEYSKPKYKQQCQIQQYAEKPKPNYKIRQDYISFVMKRPQYRTRQFSNQNYRRSKLSYQNIISKNTVMQKSKTNFRDTSYDEIQKQLIAPIKPPFNLSASSWCLFNIRNSQFVGFRESQQREVASLTKIMTTILAINLIQRYGLDKQIAVRVSRNAASLNGTSAQLKQGKWVRLEDLLYGTMLPSGNDAAYLLSEVMGLLLFYERMKPQDKEYADIQSIDITLYDNTLPFINRFVKQMNKLAKELKLHKTSFVNPHGLANALNFSCAKDMMELSKYSCSNKEFLKIANTEEYQCDLFNQDLETVYDTKIWTNTNKLLKRGWEGVKTGQTATAGCCLSSLKNGIYIVILNCLTPQSRFTETQLLYQWYMRNSEDEYQADKQL